MYRYNTSLASTPPNSGGAGGGGGGGAGSGRRSGRAVRGSVKRRQTDGSSRGGGGLKRKFQQIAQTLAKKWVKVYRAPAPNISFKVPVWVPYVDLTHEERLEYDRKENAVPESLDDPTSTTNDRPEQGRDDGAADPESFGDLPEPFDDEEQDDGQLEELRRLDEALDILEENLIFSADDVDIGEGEPATKRAKLDHYPDVEP